MQIVPYSSPTDERGKLIPVQDFGMSVNASSRSAPGDGSSDKAGSIP